jgi:hypothetical protein
MSEFYIENVLGYRKTTLDQCAKYQRKEINAIYNIKHNNNNNNNHLKQLPHNLRSNPIFEIKFDLAEPKV